MSKLPPSSDDTRSADDYIAEIVRRDTEQAARPPPEAQRRPRGKRMLLILGPLFVVLSAWNVVRALDEPVVFTVQQEEADARFTIYLVAQELAAYRDTAGTLPANLEALGLEDDYLQYARADDGYRLTFELDEIYLTYRSGEDLAPFADGYVSLEDGGQP